MMMMKLIDDWNPTKIQGPDDPAAAVGARAAPRLHVLPVVAARPTPALGHEPRKGQSHRPPAQHPPQTGAHHFPFFFSKFLWTFLFRTRHGTGALSFQVSVSIRICHYLSRFVPSLFELFSVLLPYYLFVSLWTSLYNSLESFSRLNGVQRFFVLN